MIEMYCYYTNTQLINGFTLQAVNSEMSPLHDCAKTEDCR
jgi:hypothetical protein